MEWIVIAEAPPKKKPVTGARKRGWATAAIVQELLLKINASGLSAHSLFREHTADDVIGYWGS